MISVVIPLYNKAASIAATIQSVLDQTFQDFEIIVVDDGSTDGGPEVVRGFKDKRVRIISQENAGVSAARNRGIREARGEVVALLDADDEWKPDYLKTQFGLTQKFPDCDVFAINYEFHDKEGKTSPTIINNIPFSGDEGRLDNYFQVASTSHPPICSISIMVRKKVFETIGGFPTEVKSGEDLLTWARMSARFGIAYSRAPLAVFNVIGYYRSERPKRLPAEDDIVHRELVKIQKEFNPPYIKNYISHWHKMRSSVYMRLRMRKSSIREALIGLRYNPLNYKLGIFILLNLLPKKVQPF